MRLLVIFAVATLAACTEPGSSVSNGQTGSESAVPEAEPDSNVVSEPIKSGPAAPPEDEADQCGAGAYQWLVGQPRSRIPDKPAGAPWRVTCTGCPITMDYSPARLNIFYDEETEIVESVKCG